MPGDTVWIVTAWSGGHLILLGPVLVDERTDQETAARRLGLSADNLWQASHHILAPKGRAAVAQEIDLSDVAADLRFESDNDRLYLREPSRIGKQLQAMRRLTPASATLLRAKWAEEANYDEAIADARVGERHGQGFSSPESNAKVERAAVALVTSDLERDGWTVRSVEGDRIGYDLLCTRDSGEERHVEVKGTRGDGLAFMLTDREARRAEDDPDFWLYLVTNALAPEPRLLRFSAEEVRRAFTFVPLVYRAIPATITAGERLRNDVARPTSAPSGRTVYHAGGTAAPAAPTASDCLDMRPRPCRRRRRGTSLVPAALHS